MGKRSKDKRDLYYRKAKEQGYRARSAFKLLQLNEQYHFLDDPNLKRVVDLCAAPGSWSQVLSRKLFVDNKSEDDSGKKIIAVDLQPMSPIDNVTCLQADITHPKTFNKILELFGNEKAQFVCSDGAPDVTGLHDLDEYVQQQLIMSALQLTTCILEKGGVFIAKIFRGRDIDLLYSQLGFLFKKIICAKPRSSRGTSLEAFIVCLDYCPPKDWVPKLDLNKSVTEFFEGCNIKEIHNNSIITKWYEEDRDIVDFMTCGSLDAYDSDATYHIDVKDELSNDLLNVSLNPVQMPTNPPYKRALELKRKGKLTRSI
ncbi:hypothetical protein TPHA_0M01140 [Tetrapisispora phaffii CBS 4417]|uniref:Putative tRNA (cytidine(32)/guanosine(34)-2'-O)-methyltransferase n=1 Tax=Tetrapisispora phaffii (strain ATCC 24235 / CBS 4417 / NBRC 1672 / NRRL Y-8282 / UCD 70-5) TaxID=1071381 RepID=G8C0H4_TETPH|nr:hypothetical protein TPHA_0M01140 [Tetrapisispora phaffii CBS 4417]CCE65689.1 hypothetical protein TPHA_0M01140 [Tetrapisispora phaffii CBS 4417]